MLQVEAEVPQTGISYLDSKLFLACEMKWGFRALAGMSEPKCNYGGYSSWRRLTPQKVEPPEVKVGVLIWGGTGREVEGWIFFRHSNICNSLSVCSSDSSYPRVSRPLIGRAVFMSPAPSLRFRIPRAPLRCVLAQLSATRASVGRG